jgi:hypothetical protein
LLELQVAFRTILKSNTICKQKKLITANKEAHLQAVRMPPEDDTIHKI